MEKGKKRSIRKNRLRKGRGNEEEKEVKKIVQEIMEGKGGKKKEDRDFRYNEIY